ncbi:MAG TPA: hypothetical protein EYP85_02630 [Armatimonadetes bacterium]|nr:hypothetical protein [Armatimonadota bacterium]
MNLTARQREFLSHLVALYGETGLPVHYTAVAKRMGVSKWSAYDMMIRLVRKGLAKREYLPEREGRRPGRFPVTFRPTPEGEMALVTEEDASNNGAEWEEVKERILSKLRAARGVASQRLRAELLASLPTRQSALAYCGELLTALMLSVDNLKQRLRELPALRRLFHGREESESRLLTLAGLSLGLSLRQGESREQEPVWGEYLARYESYVRRMGQVRRRVLFHFVRQVMELLGIGPAEFAEG